MTIEYSQDGAVVTNDASLNGTPAVLISGDDVHFTNRSTGNISSNSVEQGPAILVTGLNATIVNEAGGSISRTPMSGDAIVGGAGDDTVINSGFITGEVRLGDGADTYIDRRGYTFSGDIHFGAGDDVLRHEYSSTSGYAFVHGAAGGDGYDTLVIAGHASILNGQSVTEFEALEFTAGISSYWNLMDFSGFSAVTLVAGGHFNFIESANPGVDLTLSGGSVAVGTGSVFRDITGSGADEVFEIRSSGTIRDVDLGGGSDIFWYHHFPEYNPDLPVIEGVVDGGAGNDQIILSVGGGITVDMAKTTGFEFLNTGTWTSATSDVRIINATGFSRIDTDTEGKLVIGQTNAPGTTVGLSFPTTLILESTATVGAVGFNLDWASTITEGQAGFSTSVTNQGTVLGDVRFYAGNDIFDGRLGTVGGSIYGFAGDDYLRGSAVVDRMWGGYGNDRLDGNDGNDRLYGEAGNDQIDGGAGDDWIEGGAGNDVLHLWNGGGDETVLAGEGNDTLFFGGTLAGTDLVNGGAGVDTLVLQGPYGSLTLSAHVTQIENVSILAGSNTAFGEPGTNLHDYVLTTSDVNFAAGVQARINGAALLAGEDFTFDGSAETNASFVVYGGKGKDSLTGGLGNDIFFYAEERFASGDTVNGGAGYDGMFLRGNYTIDFTAPGYTGLFTGIENLTLTSATDERYARGGGTEFDYNLILSDAIVGAGQMLTVSGALLMASETMILDAGQESDGTLRLFGGKASDTLKGGALADLLHGNLGADTLAGNGGADSFRYQDIAESNASSMDQILDFTPGTDKIELDRIDADTATAGNQAFSWIGSNAFSGTAGELRAYEQGGSWFVEGDTNGDSVADLVIALTLQGQTPLSAGDFLL